MRTWEREAPMRLRKPEDENAEVRIPDTPANGGYRRMEPGNLMLNPHNLRLPSLYLKHRVSTRSVEVPLLTNGRGAVDVRMLGLCLLRECVVPT